MRGRAIVVPFSLAFNHANWMWWAGAWNRHGNGEARGFSSEVKADTAGGMRKGGDDASGRFKRYTLLSNTRASSDSRYLVNMLDAGS